MCNSADSLRIKATIPLPASHNKCINAVIPRKKKKVALNLKADNFETFTALNESLYYLKLLNNWTNY